MDNNKVNVVNGAVVGIHLGAPMQDATPDKPEDNEVYATERNTVTRVPNSENTWDEQPKPTGGVSSWNDLTDKPFDEQGVIMPEALPDGYPVREEKTVFEFRLDPNVAIDEQPVPNGYTREQNEWGGWDFTANAADVGLSFVIGNIDSLLGAKYCTSIDDDRESYIGQNDVYDGEFQVDNLRITNDGVVTVSVYSYSDNNAPYRWRHVIKTVKFLTKKVFDAYEDDLYVINYSDVEAAIANAYSVEIHLHSTDGKTQILRPCSIAQNEMKFCAPWHSWNGIGFTFLLMWPDEYFLDRYTLTATKSEN